MTLSRFVSKNAFRNKRRSVLTVLSVAFSLLLLTLMMSIWRAFFLDEGSAESAQMLVVRDRVSVIFSILDVYRGTKCARLGVCRSANQLVPTSASRLSTDG